MADDSFDPDAASITVNVALLQIGSKLVWGKPKTRAGERVVGLDAGSVKAGKAHQSRRRRERLAVGGAWEDCGRMFTTELGAPLNPDWISRRFKALAKEAGLPGDQVPRRAAHRCDAGSSGQGRREDRLRDARSLDHPHHGRPVSARLGSDAGRRGRNRCRAAARAEEAGDRLMTACPHPAPIFGARATAGAGRGFPVRGIHAGQRRAWDSNPRCRSPDTVVFKTTAIGH